MSQVPSQSSFSLLILLAHIGSTALRYRSPHPQSQSHTHVHAHARTRKRKRSHYIQGPAHSRVLHA
ncbi:hypothetical protein BDW02DRAFT_568795 [Decorospora gaudefroyi]|uniref:Secreted protein n=1 Tax=Decorospora gaudefroyi TaxID=184978 RepID=A0A6A5KFH7_9PLEO|nr:hypothetical protein BDW02DRAFT_568795 [Decorospora gaudefroyi]